jgi:hypothetical protein
MKLKNELSEAIRRYSYLKKEDASQVIREVYESGKFKVLEERIHWLFFNGFYSAKEIVHFYKKYSCTDRHVYTLAKQAFNSLEINIDEVIKDLKN